MIPHLVTPELARPGALEEAPWRKAGAAAAAAKAAAEAAEAVAEAAAAVETAAVGTAAVEMKSGLGAGKACPNVRWWGAKGSVLALQNALKARGQRLAQDCQKHENSFGVQSQGLVGGLCQQPACTGIGRGGDGRGSGTAIGA